MVRKRKEFPEKNDLVICTITKVFSHGAFAVLNEYGNKEGFIHISEIASTWIKNIRDFVKEGQKTVAKVLSVDTRKGNIDLSVRRVAESQKKNKMQSWKEEQKAEKLLELTAKKVGDSLDDAYNKVGFKLEDRYGAIYAGLEEISATGKKALKGIDIPGKWVEPLVKIAKENVAIPVVRIKGFLELKSQAPNGVEIIREALIKARDENTDSNVNVEIKYVGSPKYMVRVTASDYKTAETTLKKVADMAIDRVSKYQGEGTFARE